MKKLAIIPLIFLLGCAASAPKWADKQKCKKGFYCAVGIAETNSRTVSANQAKQNALGNLTTSIEADNDVRGEEALETAGRNAMVYFNQVTKTQAAVMLKDVIVSKQETVTKGKYYTTYVLIEVNKGALRERELEELQKNDEVYQRLRGTKLIEDAKAEMEEYRKRKGS